MNVSKMSREKIAAALDNDGMQWRTRPTDDSEPQTFEELIEAHGGASLEWRDGYRTGDTVRYSFSDGSMITVSGEASALSMCCSGKGRPVTNVKGTPSSAAALAMSRGPGLRSPVQSGKSQRRKVL